MFTQRELKRVGDIIKQIARENHVSEYQVRADMQEAMESARRNTDPLAQARWKEFRYSGANPTLEEFILWVASMAVKAKATLQ